MAWGLKKHTWLIAALWGNFKYFIMYQNTWLRPVLWNAAASTLVLSIFCCVEVAAAGTPCLSASCEDESLTCLHLHSEPDFKPQRLKKWDPSNQLWFLWLIRREFFPVCVCVCGGNVAQWRGPSVWRGSEWLTGLSRFIIRVCLGCGWPLDLHPPSQMLCSNNSCQKVWNCLFSG